MLKVSYYFILTVSGLYAKTFLLNICADMNSLELMICFFLLKNPVFIVGIHGKPLLSQFLTLKWCGLMSYVFFSQSQCTWKTGLFQKLLFQQVKSLPTVSYWSNRLTEFFMVSFTDEEPTSFPVLSKEKEIIHKLIFLAHHCHVFEVCKHFESIDIAQKRICQSSCHLPGKVLFRILSPGAISLGRRLCLCLYIRL